MRGKLFDMATGVPWLIRQETLQNILEIAARENVFDEDARRWLQETRQNRAQVLAARQGRPIEGTNAATFRDGVATIPIIGPIFRYSDWFTEVCALATTEAIGADFNTVLADPSVRGIILEIDSPGGEAAGLGELAGMIAAARAVKPTVAYVSDWGASGAYWLASAAGEVVLSAQSAVGSVGAVIGVRDPSKVNSKNVEFVSSQSPSKRADPHTDAGRAQYQKLADDLAAVFIADVARHRGVSEATVIAEFGGGGVLMGKAAVAAGMADRIGSYESVLSDLAGGRVSGRRPSYAAASAAAEPGAGGAALTAAVEAWAARHQARPAALAAPAAPAPNGTGLLSAVKRWVGRRNGQAATTEVATMEVPDRNPIRPMVSESVGAGPTAPPVPTGGAASADAVRRYVHERNNQSHLARPPEAKPPDPLLPPPLFGFQLSQLPFGTPHPAPQDPDPEVEAALVEALLELGPDRALAQARAEIGRLDDQIDGASKDDLYWPGQVRLLVHRRCWLEALVEALEPGTDEDDEEEVLAAEVEDDEESEIEAGEEGHPDDLDPDDEEPEDDDEEEDLAAGYEPPDPGEVERQVAETVVGMLLETTSYARILADIDGRLGRMAARLGEIAGASALNAAAYRHGQIGLEPFRARFAELLLEENKLRAEHDALAAVRAGLASTFPAEVGKVIAEAGGPTEIALGVEESMLLANPPGPTEAQVAELEAIDDRLNELGATDDPAADGRLAAEARARRVQLLSERDWRIAAQRAGTKADAARMVERAAAGNVPSWEALCRIATDRPGAFPRGLAEALADCAFDAISAAGPEPIVSSMF
jgi:ClpP class serine protease